MGRAEKTKEYRTIPDRKVKRIVAKYNMKKAGISDRRIKEKNPKTNRTFFAEHWKEYCTLEDNK